MFTYRWPLLKRKKSIFRFSGKFSIFGQIFHFRTIFSCFVFRKIIRFPGKVGIPSLYTDRTVLTFLPDERDMFISFLAFWWENKTQKLSNLCRWKWWRGGGEKFSTTVVDKAASVMASSHIIWKEGEEEGDRESKEKSPSRFLWGAGGGEREKTKHKRQRDAWRKWARKNLFFYYFLFFSGSWNIEICL